MATEQKVLFLIRTPLSKPRRTGFTRPDGTHITTNHEITESFEYASERAKKLRILQEETIRRHRGHQAMVSNSTKYEDRRKRKEEKRNLSANKQVNG